MIENKDILSLNYYNYGQPFSGSYKGMRYRIEKQAAQDGAGAENDGGSGEQQDILLVTVWPEPFSYENTDPDVMISEKFEFSEEGKAAAVGWLNSRYEEGKWREGFTMSGLRKLRKEV